MLIRWDNAQGYPLHPLADHGCTGASPSVNGALSNSFSILIVVINRTNQSHLDTQIMLTVVFSILAWELINYIIARIKHKDNTTNIGLTPDNAHSYGLVYCKQCKAYHTPNYGHKP